MREQIRKARQEESGFTLIELLMVIVILGILAGIVVFSVSGVTDKGNAAACKADYKAVQVASEAYYAKNGSYATAIGPASTATTLMGGGFLRTAPQADKGYTITYAAATGAVSATGACTV